MSLFCGINHNNNPSSDASRRTSATTKSDGGTTIAFPCHVSYGNVPDDCSDGTNTLGGCTNTTAGGSLSSPRHQQQQQQERSKSSSFARAASDKKNDKKTGWKSTLKKLNCAASHHPHHHHHQRGCLDRDFDQRTKKLFVSAGDGGASSSNTPAANSSCTTTWTHSPQVTPEAHEDNRQRRWNSHRVSRRHPQHPEERQRVDPPSSSYRSGPVDVDSPDRRRVGKLLSSQQQQPSQRSRYVATNHHSSSRSSRRSVVTTARNHSAPVRQRIQPPNQCDNRSDTAAASSDCSGFADFANFDQQPHLAGVVDEHIPLEQPQPPPVIRSRSSSSSNTRRKNRPYIYGIPSGSASESTTSVNSVYATGVSKPSVLAGPSISSSVSDSMSPSLPMAQFHVVPNDSIALTAASAAQGTSGTIPVVSMTKLTTAVQDDDDDEAPPLDLAFNELQYTYSPPPPPKETVQADGLKDEQQQQQGHCSDSVRTNVHAPVQQISVPHHPDHHQDSSRTSSPTNSRDDDEDDNALDRLISKIALANAKNRTDDYRFEACVTPIRRPEPSPPSPLDPLFLHQNMDDRSMSHHQYQQYHHDRASQLFGRDDSLPYHVPQQHPHQAHPAQPPTPFDFGYYQNAQQQQYHPQLDRKPNEIRDYYYRMDDSNNNNPLRKPVQLRSVSSATTKSMTTVTSTSSTTAQSRDGTRGVVASQQLQHGQHEGEALPSTLLYDVVHYNADNGTYQYWGDGNEDTGRSYHGILGGDVSGASDRWATFGGPSTTAAPTKHCQ